MGDRGQVLVRTSRSEDVRGVLLYTHWYGDQMAAVVHACLSRKARWRDPSYLARMLFSEFIKKDVMGETGYGLGVFPGDLAGDLNNALILVDPFGSHFPLVHFCKGADVNRFHHTFSFDDYIEYSSEEVVDLHQGRAPDVSD